jgi:hypothetical protein
MKIVMTWGLRCTDQLLLGVTFFQFFMFHLISFPVVYYFYPINMYLLLSLIPIIAFDEWRIAKATAGSASTKKSRQHAFLPEAILLHGQGTTLDVRHFLGLCQL